MLYVTVCIGNLGATVLEVFRYREASALTAVRLGRELSRWRTSFLLAWQLLGTTVLSDANLCEDYSCYQSPGLLYPLPFMWRCTFL